MSNIKISKVDSLPPVRRGGGRRSPERDMLVEKIQTKEPMKISDVEAGNPYNALQQKIRSAAKAANLKVNVMFDPTNDDKTVGDVYFQGYDPAAVVDESELADDSSTSTTTTKRTRSRSTAKK